MKYVSLVLFPLMLASGSVLASDVPGGASHGSLAENAGHGQVATAQSADEFSALDTNHDGVLSKAEMRRHPKAAHMAMVDENRDGALSRDEFSELTDM